MQSFRFHLPIDLICCGNTNRPKKKITYDLKHFSYNFFGKNSPPTIII